MIGQECVKSLKKSRETAVRGTERSGNHVLPGDAKRACFG